MFQDTRPAALGADHPQDWADFRVDSPTEIRSLLRQLRDGNTPLVLSAPDGATVVAELWSFDSDQQRVNLTGDDNNPALQGLVDADEAVAVAYLDNVKLQFDLQDLLLVRGPRSCALQARCPQVVYRFQRRSAYRVRTLERHSPSARLRHPALPDMRLDLRVLDVSIGGCALFLPADVPPLEPGLTLQGVQVELDADTRFTATLQIQHISSINPQAQGLRVGCEWRTLEREAERSLQRYIDQTQKRRRLLALD
jgi:c-di-GMP-binding flagellar brake protein YcgR